MLPAIALHSTLQLAQISLKLEDKSQQHNLSDVRKAFEAGDDILGFTEVQPFVSNLHKTADSFGYNLYLPRGSDVAIATLNKIVSRKISYPVKGRALATVRIRWVDGSIVSFTETHIHKQDLPNLCRVQLRALEDRVRGEGHGSRLAFFGTDSNVNLRHDNIFKGTVLQTVFEELHHYVDTHGSGITLDALGQFRRDSRSVAKSVSSDKDVFSDHYQTFADYTIRNKR